MSWSFNPFTGNLDLVGGGAVVFEGEVETFADLPETIGDPAVGASFLVRSSTGVWLVNRRQAGIWIRRNNTGVRATDWEYGGDYPVNSVAGKTGNVTLTNSDISGLGSAATANLNAISDADFRLIGSTDATKKVAIEVDSLVSAGTTRTLTVPNGDATIAATPVSRLQQFFSSQTYNVAEGLNVELQLQNSIPSCAIVVVLPRLTTDGARNGDEILISPLSLASGSSYTLQRYTWTGSSYAGSTETITTMEAGQTYRLRLVGGVWTLLVTPNLASPPAIGSTTRNTGAFTTLNATNGTITASAPVLDLAQTWNNAAVTFTGLRFNVTNTASAAASLLADFQVGGTTQFAIRRNGSINVPSQISLTLAGQATPIEFDGSGTPAPSVVANQFIANGDVMLTGGRFGTGNVIIRTAGASSAVEVRGTTLTTPQAFRIYNTTDAGLTNFERGFMRWSSNVLQIGTEKLGTGSARNLQFLTDNTARITIDTSGNFGINVSTPERPFHISGSSMWARFDRVGSVGPAIMMVRQATLGSTNSSWLLGSPNTAGVSNEDFALIDYGVNISGTVGTPRLTIAKSDGQLTVNGNLNLSTKDLVTDTTTGTKIGTGTTQKLGFFNATPIVRPAAIADATDAATTQARLNDLLAAVRSLGLIAT